MTQIRYIKESIASARKEKGYTQREMANKLDISQPAYSYYEKGAKPLPVHQLEKVLEILDLDLKEIQSNEPDPLRAINNSLIRIGDLLEEIANKM